MNMYNPHELYHHGILGMKWGVRRFQNKDGTLTPAGRKRKAKLEAQYEKVTGKKVQEEAERKPLTDDELKNRTARVKAESDLMSAEIAWRDNYAKLHPPSAGKQFVEKSRNKIIDNAVDLVVNTGKKWLEKKISAKIGLEKNESEHDRLKRISDEMAWRASIARNQEVVDEYNKKRKENQ